MAVGTVKWFNPDKGYGFITPQDGGADVFVHMSALDGLADRRLNDGQKVEYEIAMNKGKKSAVDLKLIKD